MVGLEAGWPDVSFHFKHGIADIADLGAKLSLIYGVEGDPNFVQFGFGLTVPWPREEPTVS